MADVLHVQVQADNAGWSRVVPAVMVGLSGVSHRFSVVAKRGGLVSAFDVLEEVGELEILGAYIQSLDTKARVVLICSSGTVTEDARQMAEEYGVKVISPGEIPGYFKDEVLAPKCGRTISDRS